LKHNEDKAKKELEAKDTKMKEEVDKKKKEEEAE